ncbi:MAG: hypothetical protein WCC87_08910 [Candidatus Korobacteraceae bacterium]
MADNIRVEVDVAAGKLSLECPESSLDSILARLADFLPKFRNHAQPVSGQTPRHAQRVEVDEPILKRGNKAANGSADAGAKKRVSAPARASAAPEARPEVQQLQLNVDEPGLVAWGSLTKDWKKYLWILEAAHKRNVDGLTNGEIIYLMVKTFREARSPKVVNNLKKKIKDRFVQPHTVNSEGKVYSVWRILADGSKEVVQAAGAAKA